MIRLAGAIKVTRARARTRTRTRTRKTGFE
jgi:hypothetical protein